jgi:hypothetical protein
MNNHLLTNHSAIVDIQEQISKLKCMDEGFIYDAVRIFTDVQNVYGRIKVHIIQALRYNKGLSATFNFIDISIVSPSMRNITITGMVL